MTRGSRMAATRSNLMRARRRLAQVRKGAALLKRKRESLVDELFARARTAVRSREGIDTEAREAWRTLWEALAALGAQGLAPLGWPTREIPIELTTTDLWGLKVVELAHRPAVVRSLSARGTLPAPGEASAEEAARHFERVVELLLDAAPEEHLMRRLGQVLSRTTRLVNTLEQRVGAGLAAEAAAIRRTLEEREREEHQRTRRLMASRLCYTERLSQREIRRP